MWKVSRQSGKFPDNLETFQTIWKLSKQSGKFPDVPESFQTGWKVSRQCGEFPDTLESFGQSGKFPDCPESWMSRKQFTHFWRIYFAKAKTHLFWKVFAREILPTGKFWLFVSLSLCQLVPYPRSQVPVWSLTRQTLHDTSLPRSNTSSNLCPRSQVPAWSLTRQNLYCASFQRSNVSKEEGGITLVGLGW